MKHKLIFASLFFIVCLAEGQLMIPGVPKLPPTNVILPPPQLPPLPPPPPLPLPPKGLGTGIQLPEPKIKTTNILPPSTGLNTGIIIPISSDQIIKTTNILLTPVKQTEISIREEDIISDNEKANDSKENEKENKTTDARADEKNGNETEGDDGFYNSIIPPMLNFISYKDNDKKQVSVKMEQTTIGQLKEQVVEEYEIIFECNPLTWVTSGYVTDRSKQLVGTLKRVLYILILTDKLDRKTCVAVSFCPPTQNLADLGIPKPGSPVLQTPVTDLNVATNIPNIIKTGYFLYGSIEFWPFDYKPDKGLDLPNASDKTYDFDDTPLSTGNHTSMQIHNIMERQVIMAINKPHEGINGELGIGNNTSMPPHGDKSQMPNPDWTYTNSARLYKSAVLIIAGQFDNLMLKDE